MWRFWLWIVVSKRSQSCGVSLESSQEQISEAFSGDTELYEEFTLKLKLWIITLEGKTRSDNVSLH